jgi:guanine deaminase
MTDPFTIDTVTQAGGDLLLCDHDRLIRTAVDIAVTSAHEGHRPFGALVAHGDRIIGTGRDVTCALGDPTSHAEICAIRAARTPNCPPMAECAVYASCEPCLMCTAAILRSGIAEIYYAAPRELAEASGYPDVVTPAALRALVPSSVIARCLRAELGTRPFHAKRAMNAPSARSPHSGIELLPC